MVINHERLVVTVLSSPWEKIERCLHPLTPTGEETLPLEKGAKAGKRTSFSNHFGLWCVTTDPRQFVP